MTVVIQQLSVQMSKMKRNHVPRRQKLLHQVLWQHQQKKRINLIKKPNPLMSELKTWQETLVWRQNSSTREVLLLLSGKHPYFLKIWTVITKNKCLLLFINNTCILLRQRTTQPNLLKLLRLNSDMYSLHYNDTLIGQFQQTIKTY